MSRHSARASETFAVRGVIPPIRFQLQYRICYRTLGITPCIHIGLCKKIYIYFDPAGLVKITLFGSLPVMNNERDPASPPPAPPPAPAAAAAAAAAAPAPAPVAHKENSQRELFQTRSDSQVESASAAEGAAAGDRPSQQAKAERAEQLAEEAANKRPIGRPKKDCYGLTIQFSCEDTAGAQLLCTAALTLMRGKLCGRGKMSGRRRGHALRLPALKQHHQHTRAAAAAAGRRAWRARTTAAVAAVIVARGRGSRSSGGRRVVEQSLSNSHANSMLAFLCTYVIFHFNCP